MIQPIYSVIFMCIVLMAIPYKGFSVANHLSGRCPQGIFHEGILLFNEHQYTSAQKHFEVYLSRQGKKYKQEEAAYYAILSALANKDPHIAILLQYFIVRYPTSSYTETVRYHLAKFFSEKGFFHKSLSLYQSIKTNGLPSKERATLPYAIGNVYLQLKDWVNAKKYFVTIDDTNHPYYYPAQLQMAYIAFEEGDYDGALKVLEKSNQKYGLETQSFILKVYHKAGKFASLLSYVQSCPAPSLGKQDHLLIADAYFFLKQYEPAIIHYQAALEGGDAARNTCTKLGYALYATQQYAQALVCFRGLFDQHDHAHQMATYYVGLIYEKNGDMQGAIDCFSTAERLNFDPKISELAAIKLAGLRYQKGEIKEAIASMTNFIAIHQASEHLAIAQALLIQCYYKTKAYQLAIDYIAGLPYKTEPLLRLYQKVLFYQGIEAYNTGTLDRATKCLAQSILFPFKPSLVLQAQFWLGEAFSALGKYEKALKFYTQYMAQGSLDSLHYAQNLYGLAYAYFNTGHYTTAAQTFEQYIARTQKQAGHYDATLRLADCYYVKKNYQEALNLYARVYTYHPAHVRYQEALIYHALGDNLRAERCLQEVLTNHTETKYYEKACYHKGCTIFNAGNYEAAIQSFTHLIQRDLTSDLRPDVLMKRALAYENLQKYEAAAADYTTILDEYPTHLHAESALMALSNLFAAQGSPEKTDIYLKKYDHIAQKMTTHSDERTIDAARQLFYNQAYDKVFKQLAGFDKKYPESLLLSEAYFLIAESYYRLQKNKQAISHYKKVVAGSPTRFHKKSWLRIADLAYQAKRFQEAITHYQKLQNMQLTNKEYHQTLIGLMKASFACKQYEITTPTCLQLLNNPKEASVETIQQAALYLGKVALQRSAYKRAKSHFLKAIKPLDTLTAAEAQYLLAHTEFKLKAYKASLHSLFDLIEKFPHNIDYIDDAFLLIADNYIMLGNLTQAKATLDSMVNQSKNKKNIERAKQKRVKVISKIKSSSHARQPNATKQEQN